MMKVLEIGLTCIKNIYKLYRFLKDQINLNEMIIQNIKQSDFVITVLIEEQAKIQIHFKRGMDLK